MDNKPEMLALLKEVYDQWEALLAGLSVAQLTAPQLPDNWAIKDVLAHLRAWQQISIARLEAALQERAPVFAGWPPELEPEAQEGPQRVNDWVYATTHAQPWSSVYPNWRNGFLRFLELGAAIPADGLFDEGKYPWLHGYPLFAVFRGSYNHHTEHLETLQAWLSTHDV